MYSFTKQTLLATVNVVTMITVVGCQQPTANAKRSQPAPTMTTKASASQQLIIKFKPGTVICDLAGIAHWSSITQVPLEFVRTMSGDACVVKQFADSTDSLSQGQKMLRQNPSVEYLELDAVMKAF